MNCKLSLLLLVASVIAVSAKHPVVFPQTYTGNCAATQNEGEVLTLGCDAGQVISSIDFASFGNPSGDCQQGFKLGSCHADKSVSVLSAKCLGNNQCSIEATNDNFGGDPCYLTYKHLAAKVTCRPTVDVTCNSAAEGQSLTVACADRKYINRIVFASYGTPTGDCKKGFTMKRTCHASQSNDVVAAQCVGHTQCTVLSSNDNFGGDPCYGYVKQLAVNVSCVPEINLDMTCNTASEGEQLYVGCYAGKTISMINFASYGTPAGRCATFAKSTCHSPQSLSVLTEKCLGKANCQVQSTNDNFGGDPCYGEVKQLAVSVTCSLPSPAEVTCATAAEGQTLTLSCSGGRKINAITFASYGNPGGTCPNPSQGTCHSTSSTSVLQSACVGKQVCSVAATNAAFGEPCYLTAKKLVATATCA